MTLALVDGYRRAAQGKMLEQDPVLLNALRQKLMQRGQALQPTGRGNGLGIGISSPLMHNLLRGIPTLPLSLPAASTTTSTAVRKGNGNGSGPRIRIAP
jgi:hypothetical protein